MVGWLPCGDLRGPCGKRVIFIVFAGYALTKSIHSSHRANNRRTHFPRAAQGRPEGGPRAAQGRPKGGPRATKGRRKGDEGKLYPRQKFSPLPIHDRMSKNLVDEGTRSHICKVCSVKGRPKGGPRAAQGRPKGDRRATKGRRKGDGRKTLSPSTVLTHAHTRLARGRPTGGRRAADGRPTGGLGSGNCRQSQAVCTFWARHSRKLRDVSGCLHAHDMAMMKIADSLRRFAPALTKMAGRLTLFAPP